MPFATPDWHRRHSRAGLWPAAFAPPQAAYLPPTIAPVTAKAAARRTGKSGRAPATFAGDHSPGESVPAPARFAGAGWWVGDRRASAAGWQALTIN